MRTAASTTQHSSMQFSLSRFEFCVAKGLQAGQTGLIRACLNKTFIVGDHRSNRQ